MKEYKSMLQALRKFGGQSFGYYSRGVYDNAHREEAIKVNGGHRWGSDVMFRTCRDASDTYVPTLATFVKNGGVEIISKEIVLKAKAEDALDIIKNVFGYSAFEEARAKMMKPYSGYTKEKVVYGKVLTPEQFIEKKTQEFNEYLKSL